MREFFTRLAGALAVDPVPLDPAGGALGDAVVAVAAAAAAAAGRWPGMVAVSGWELAAVLTLGSLLSPVVLFARVRGDTPCLRSVPWPDRSTRASPLPGAAVCCHSRRARVAGAREGTSVTTLDEADRKARLERARETGLFRYSLVQELAEPGLTARGTGAAGQGAGRPCP